MTVFAAPAQYRPHPMKIRGRVIRIPGQPVRAYPGVPEPENLTAWTARPQPASTGRGGT
jgi:hypothetical protein